MRHRSPVSRHGIALFVISATLLALTPTAFAKTYMPDKTGDSPSGGLSLREAITKANNHTGSDEIVLRAGKTYRLSLANSAGDEDLNSTGDLDINDLSGSGLKIVSDGRDHATVNAQGIDRVFETQTSGKFVRLRVRGGSTSGNGGGISRGAGAVVLRGSRVAGNLAGGDGGGIEVGSGGLSVSRSVISGNRANQSGGGIYAEDGPTWISKSTIKNNVADADADGSGDSGGLENEVSMTIKSSTISGNATSGTAGGGGIRNRGGTLSLVNSTIANNAATNAGGVGGGGLVSNGSSAAVSMNAVTIARNSAGSDAGGFDYDGGSFSVRNSLIALNTAPAAPNCQGGAGVTSFGQNLIGNNTNCNFSAASGDRVNLSSSQINIGQLDDNGGPTKTIKLKSGSAAIDKAGPDAPKRDQRGEKRDDPGGPDIGAFERM